jgi:pyroglutamyl-peptidase
MTGHRHDLLITGFGPYPRVRVNPTATLARALARDRRWQRLGLRVTAHVFETSYAAVARDAPALFEDAPARALLHLGLAPRARWLRIETTGRGNPSRLAADRRGSRGARTATAAPLVLRSTAPVAAALAALHRAGLPARLSNHAGRYLCDTLYHRSLAAAHGAGARRPVLFVHLPKPVDPARRTDRAGAAKPTGAAMLRALRGLALRLAVAGRTGG